MLAKSAPMGVLRDAWAEPLRPIDPETAVGQITDGKTKIVTLAFGVWLLGVMPGSLGQTGTAVPALITVGVWLYTVLRRPRETILLIVAVTATAAWILWFTSSGASEIQTPLAAAWFDAAAVIAGLGMATLRRGVTAVVSVAAVSLIGWTFIAATEPALTGGYRTALAWSVATTGLGLATAAATAVVRRGAHRLDAMTRQTQRAATEEDVAAAAREQFQQFGRLLHDTVINTLGAVGYGVPESRVAELQGRCAQDLELMDSAALSQTDDPIDLVTARAAVLGITLRVHGPRELVIDLPASVSAAAAAALGEGLVNVSKHAGVTEAQLWITRAGDHLALTLEDTGRGWSGPIPADRGIALSIVKRCAEAGISTQVTSVPGRGTAIRLDMPAPPTDQESAAEQFRAETRMIAVVACGAIIAEVGIRTLLTIGLMPALGGILAWSLLALVFGFAWRSSRLRDKPTNLTCLLLALVSTPVILLLPEEATGPLAWGWWATIVSLPVFGLLLLLNAHEGWLFVAYASQMVGRALVLDHHPGVLFPGAVTIALGGFALWMVRRAIYRMVAQHSQLAEQSAARRERAVLARAGQRVSARQLRQVTMPARHLLADIAMGRVSCTDPEVRSRAATEAQYLRNVSRLGPHLAEPGLGLLTMLSTAHEQGTHLRFSIDPAVNLPGHDPALEEFVDMVREQLRPGARCSLSVYRSADDPDATCMNVVCEDRVPLLTEEQVGALRSQGLEVEQAAEDGDVSVEVSWQDRSAAGVLHQ